jgi:hypothetical protein
MPPKSMTASNSLSGYYVFLYNDYIPYFDDETKNKGFYAQFLGN